MDKTTKYTTLSSELLFQNPYWNYRFDKYILPNGETGDYHFVDSRGSTLVIPILEDGRIIMTRQFRYLNRKFSIEFPGGGIKAELSPVENAREELHEEVGYSCGKIELMGTFNPFNGVTNEICSIFTASDLVNIGSKPESSEEFEILYFHSNQITELITKGELWDGMSLAAYALFQSKIKN
ncbi:MAG: NUDIX hydrolase [Candidatus Kapabacteria bacterium]|nr:NUDIX hydrolase [Candidatus Kapabacteria bacterium]